MIFFIVKFIIFVGLIFYFAKFGQKINNPTQVSASWSAFFIPLYIFMFMLGIYIFIEAFAAENNWFEIIKHLLSAFIYYSGFLTSSILLPIKLDKNLKSMSGFVVAGLNTFSSIYLFIHLRFLYNK